MILNKKGITYKQRKGKHHKIDWEEIDMLYVHLFSAELILKNDGTLTIDLESLTDENLQLVTCRLQEVKEQWQI
ncbi:hypothetical protein GCM10007389_02770 [Pontibacter akesuensis]|nr:hypothetical protein GCM10007389_02770 [Pontibacter akesuensis]